MGISDLQDGHKIIHDPVTKANLFNIQFSSVFSIPTLSKPTYWNSTYPSMAKITVSRAGVLKLMANIREHKATGPDGIPGRLLKYCALELADTFTLLFQKSLEQGIVPKDWKKAKIVPIFKKGDRSKVENYRPISLTSISCKLLEHIVHSNVMDHLDAHKILNNAQHGFRQRRSCETQLITTLDDFSKCLDKKQQIDGILLDFSKAFDKVDHHKLLLKLHDFGIHNSLHTWMESFLLGRQQTVIVDGVESSPKPVLSGVPQGTVLGPLLFLIYINDITQKLSPGTVIRLFADDSLLYRIIKSPKDAEILQQDLDTLQEWEAENKMEFHPGKCLVLRITNKLKPLLFDYKIHNTILSITNSAKYLGVTIDSNLNWNQHVNNITSKANSTLAFIQRNTYSCHRNVKEKCYKAFVRPILEYGCCVWDPHHNNQIEQLEKIQKRAARFITQNYEFKSGNTRKNMENLGWVPLQERRARNKLNILFKAKHSLIDIPIDSLKSSNRKTRGNSCNFFVPSSSVDSHLYSFYPSTIRLWNSLPENIKSADSLSAFTNQLTNLTCAPTISK